MTFREWIHFAGDGRPPRNVYLNGQLVKNCTYANTKEGVIEYYDDPPVARGDELLTHRASGDVRVEVIS